MILLSSPVFTDWILPFLLVFVIVFAILQKSKVLGEKPQVDAIVGVVIGLLTVVVPAARIVIDNLVPWLAVAVVVILVFLLLYGFVGGESALKAKWLKIVFGILIGIFVIGVVLWATGAWDTVSGWFNGGSGGEIWINILVLVIIAGAIAAVVAGKKK